MQWRNIRSQITKDMV